MKVVILAGGFGMRLSEETTVKPKPLVEVGEMPILWHIMKIYSYYGFNEFIVCLGYKGYMLKEWFANYFLHKSDLTIDIKNNKIDVHDSKSEDWKVTLVDTGLNTATGGRIKRIKTYINDTFMMTYGDGVADISIKELVSFHKKHGKAATITAVQPPGRFGALDLDGEVVRNFLEKPLGDGAWINGGFFVLEPEVLNYIKGDETPWEEEPLERLASDERLMAYKHKGFWKPMDKLKDKSDLDMMWEKGKALWKVWSD